MGYKLLIGDCREHMGDGEVLHDSVDIVLTSPPYNTNKKSSKRRTVKDFDGTDDASFKSSKSFPYIRYDMPMDIYTNDEYNDFTVEVFDHLDSVLKPDGCILYNMSYGNQNTTGMVKAVNAVITRTPFTIADIMSWKKKSAMPDNLSPNRLTRICEWVFVFCRKGEEKTFKANKRVTSVRKMG